MIENVRVPEAEHRVALRAHEFVAHAVAWTVRMLASVNFDHETLFATGKIGEEATDRMLTRKVISSELTALQL